MSFRTQAAIADLPGRGRRQRLVLAIVLLMIACAACSRGDSNATAVSPLPAPQPPPTVTTLPDGSTLIVASVTGERNQPGGEQALSMAGGARGPVTLDPALLRDAQSAFLARQIFRGLVSLDLQLAVRPELAERITIAPDGLTYRFELRPDLTFHDGAPLDASAVIRSFERATNQALATGAGLPAATYLDDIEGVAERLSGESESISGMREIDARTLEIRLARPAANFLLKLTGSPALVVDVDSATGSDWWHTPNGSGPFRIAEYNVDQELRLEPFDDYATGRPFLDTVNVRFGSAALSPLNLYENGEIDLTELPGYAIDRALSGTDYLGRDLRVTPELSTTYFAFNPNLPPFDDPNLRAALARLVDREQLIEVGLAGRAEEAQGLVPPGILERSWPSDVPAYNPAAARDIYDESAGTEQPPQIFDPGGGMAVLLKEVTEQELGLDIDVIAPPFPEFSADLGIQDLPAFVLSWIADYPDPASFLTTLFHSGSPDNYTGYANPMVDALLDEAGVEADIDRRAALYLDAQQIIIDDGVLIPLYHGVSYMVVRPEVHGLDISAIGILALENVWIAS